MKKPIKLSKSQQEVVDMMRDGYELGYSSGFSNTHVWLQKGHVGCGGLSKNISLATFNAMWKAKMFVEAPKQPSGFRITAYVLADEFVA